MIHLYMSCTVLHHKYEYRSNRRGSGMGDESDQKPTEAAVRRGTSTTGIQLNPHAAGFERGGQCQISHARRLAQLSSPKKTPNTKLSFFFFLLLHFTWVNDIFIGPDITSRTPWLWFLASVEYPHRVFVLPVLCEC